MRRIVDKSIIPDENAVNVKDVDFDPCKIYAGFYSGIICVLKRIPFKDDKGYGMASMFWEDWHTCTDGDISACANRASNSQSIQFYEFDNQREFFEWALKVCK